LQTILADIAPGFLLAFSCIRQAIIKALLEPDFGCELKTCIIFKYSNLNHQESDKGKAR
jgi:hypothetical protein